MKNEKIIFMGEGDMDTRAIQETDMLTKPTAEMPEKESSVEISPIAKDKNRGRHNKTRMQSPDLNSNKQDNISLAGSGEGEEAFTLTPEVEEKLKGFYIEIVKEGKPENVTAAEIVKKLGTRLNIGEETSNSENDLFNDVSPFIKLVEKYKDLPEEGEQLRKALIEDVIAKGDSDKAEEAGKCFEDIARKIEKGSGDIEKNIVELGHIMGLNDTGGGELEKIIVSALPLLRPVSGGADANHGAVELTTAPLAAEDIPPGQGLPPAAPLAEGTGTPPEDHDEDERTRPTTKAKDETYNKVLFWLIVLAAVYLGGMGQLAKAIESVGERARQAQ